MDTIPSTVFDLYVQGPKPAESWIFNDHAGTDNDFLVPTVRQERSSWFPPVAYPQDGQIYVWNEAAHQADNTRGWDVE